MTKEQLDLAKILHAMDDPAMLFAMAAMIGATGEENGDDVSELICCYRGCSTDIIKEAVKLLDEAIVKHGRSDLADLAKSGIRFIDCHFTGEWR